MPLLGDILPILGGFGENVASRGGIFFFSETMKYKDFLAVYTPLEITILVILCLSPNSYHYNLTLQSWLTPAVPAGPGPPGSQRVLPPPGPALINTGAIQVKQ